MKKNRKKTIRNPDKKVFISEKMKSRAIIRGLLATDQTLVCCVLETGDSAPRPFLTTQDDCERLGRQVGVKTHPLPAERCSQIPG